jgi:spermidine synthase
VLMAVLLLLLFFLSGISGLIYQVLWLRLLALVFGVTVYAASAVLASFMAGLALGSFIAGRLVDRARYPLLWYGLVEVLVGLSALATPAGLDGIERLYVAFYPALPAALVPLTLVRFLLAFAVLLVPTTLMGATLPIVVNSSLLRAGGLGERISLLYATNTAGAIVGALLAGFYLIGGVGISASLWLAAALNGLVGAAAVAASVAFERPRAAAAGRPHLGERPGPAGVSAHAAPRDRARSLVLLVFALSGFAALALELVWFRVLLLFLPVTTYVFTVMLATVLCGIAAGSYLAAPLLRRRAEGLGLLAVIELAGGSVALGSFTVLARLYDPPAWSAPLRHLFGDELALVPAVAFFITFPAALLMGVAFPLGMHLYAGGSPEHSAHSGRRVGLFYSLNVCGAILGSIVAAFLLLPLMGSYGSLIAVAAISLTSGLLLLTALPPPRRSFVVGAGAGGTALFLAAAMTMPYPPAIALSHRTPGEQQLWREEGVQTTASVHRLPNGVQVLYLEGLHQANDSPGMVGVHRLIGHLPMALHHDPKEALVIGLGGGATAGAVSQHAGVRVDVVELAETVVHAADWFRHINGDVLRRPNVRLVIDDGRNYLRLTPKRYDVITADIIQPFHAGSGHLYSAEYFRLARDALKDDGLMLQWIGHRTEVQYKLIMRTFLSVFPHATLWDNGGLMVGSKRSLQLDPADFERKLRAPTTREGLEAMGLHSFEALLSAYTAGPEELHRFAGGGPILTDDRPMAEYFRSLPRDNRMVDLANVRGSVLRHVHPDALLERFVVGLYHQVLGRPPSTAEVSTVINSLAANPTSAGVSAVFRTFLDGPESQNRAVTLSSRVHALYQGILGRAPDEAGLAVWVRYLLDRFNVALPLIINSAEFQQRVPACQDDIAVTALVTRLYQRALGRTPSTPEVSGWVNSIGATCDMEGAIKAFFSSSEYLGAPRTLVQHVTVLYQSVLAREPDAGEQKSWTDYLTGELRGIAEMFINSAEFQARWHRLFGGMEQRG